MSAQADSVRYQRRSEFVMRVIAGETVLVPIRQNLSDLESIYTLDGFGTFIWQQWAEPATEGRSAATIEAEFEADPVMTRRDVEEFARELAALDAIRIVLEASGAAPR